MFCFKYFLDSIADICRINNIVNNRKMNLPLYFTKFSGRDNQFISKIDQR